MSISNINKRGRGRPRIDAKPVMVRFPPLEMKALDEHIAEQNDPKPSRPEAIRRLIQQALTAQP
jgi:hypothetical protein